VEKERLEKEATVAEKGGLKKNEALKL